MVQAIKMAARVVAMIALGVAITTLISQVIGVFVGAEGISAIINGIGIVKAFIENWMPINGTRLLLAAAGLVAIEAALIAYKIVRIVQGFALKINEG